MLCNYGSRNVREWLGHDEEYSEKYVLEHGRVRLALLLPFEMVGIRKMFLASFRGQKKALQMIVEDDLGKKL